MASGTAARAAHIIQRLDALVREADSLIGGFSIQYDDQEDTFRIKFQNKNTINISGPFAEEAIRTDDKGKAAKESIIADIRSMVPSFSDRWSERMKTLSQMLTNKFGVVIQCLHIAKEQKVRILNTEDQMVAYVPEKETILPAGKIEGTLDTLCAEIAPKIGGNFTPDPPKIQNPKFSFPTSMIAKSFGQPILPSNKVEVLFVGGHEDVDGEYLEVPARYPDEFIQQGVRYVRTEMGTSESDPDRNVFYADDRLDVHQIIALLIANYSP